MTRREKWLTLPIAIAFLGVLAKFVGAVPGIFAYFQQPEVRYSSNEVTGYPVPYDDDKPAPGAIQSEVLADGLIRILTVVVWNEGQRGADVTVRMPVSKDDKLLSGWMSDSATPKRVYLLRTETKLHLLVRGERVTFYLNLGNVKSDLASRIEVFDDEGRLATYYEYAPIRYVGGNIAFVLPIRKDWIDLISGFAVIAGLLLGVRFTVKRKLTAISTDRCTPTDAVEDLPTRSRGPKARDHEGRGRAPPSDGAAGSG